MYIAYFDESIMDLPNAGKEELVHAHIYELKLYIKVNVKAHVKLNLLMNLMNIMTLLL